MRSQPEFTVHLPKRHPAQARIVAERSRYNVACLGRRTGKTVLGLDVLIDLPGGALDGRPVAWMSPTYKLLEDTWLMARRWLQPIIARQDSQQKRLELMTGGVLDFWTLDDPDAGRGRKYARVVIDEAATARHLREAWEQAIRPTLTDYRGDAWFLSTPKGRNFFSELYERGQVDTTWGWRSWQMPTTENPYIDPNEIEAAKQDLPSLVFRQEYLAEFVDFGGSAVRREWIKVGAAPDGLSTVMGVDLAISSKQDADYSAIAALSRDANGNIYIRDVQRTRAPFHQVLQFIKSMAARWAPTLIAIEQVQYQAAVVQELLRTTGLPVRGVRPDKDKLTRFQPLAARYEQGLVWHNPGLNKEFEDELLSFPAGDHDDQADACAMAFGALSRTHGPLTARIAYL